MSKLTDVAGFEAGKKWADTASDPELLRIREYADRLDELEGQAVIPDAYTEAEHIFFAVDGSDEPGERDRTAAKAFWDHVLAHYDDDARDDPDFLLGFVHGAADTEFQFVRS